MRNLLLVSVLGILLTITAEKAVAQEGVTTSTPTPTTTRMIDGQPVVLAGDCKDEIVEVRLYKGDAPEIRDGRAYWPDLDSELCYGVWEGHRPSAKPVDIDMDDDGISDNIDECPTKPEVYNDFLDDDGCPDEVEFPDRWVDNTVSNGDSGSKLGRLTLGAFVEGYAVADRQNTTHNGVVGAIFTIGAKRTWLEVNGGLGGGAHGIGWNLKGSVGLVFDLGQRLSFGLGAMTSRWRYDREIEGNATRYDRIMNGGYLALAYDFGPVEGRLSVSFGREGHETKTEVKPSWPVEYGLGLSKSYDFLK